MELKSKKVIIVGVVIVAVSLIGGAALLSSWGSSKENSKTSVTNKPAATEPTGSGSSTASTSSVGAVDGTNSNSANSEPNKPTEGSDANKDQGTGNSEGSSTSSVNQSNNATPPPPPSPPPPTSGSNNSNADSTGTSSGQSGPDTPPPAPPESPQVNSGNNRNTEPENSQSLSGTPPPAPPQPVDSGNGSTGTSTNTNSNASGNGSVDSPSSPPTSGHSVSDNAGGNGNENGQSGMASSNTNESPSVSGDNNGQNVTPLHNQGSEVTVGTDNTQHDVNNPTNEVSSSTSQESAVSTDDDMSGFVKCGKRNDLYCDVLEAEVTGGTVGKYKVFFTFKNKKQHDEIKEKFSSEQTEEQFLGKIEDSLVHAIPNSDIKYRFIAPRLLNLAKAVEDLKHKSFKCLANEGIESSEFVLVIPGNAPGYEESYLESLSKIDYKAKGEASVEPISPAGEIIVQKAIPWSTTPEFRSYVHEIKNVFGHANLKGLFIRFGIIDSKSKRAVIGFSVGNVSISENPINFKPEDFASYEEFTKVYKNTRIVDYDHMVVIHNHLAKNDVYDALDGIKKDAAAEFELQNKANWIGYNNPEYYLFIGTEQEINNYKASLESQFLKPAEAAQSQA